MLVLKFPHRFLCVILTFFIRTIFFVLKRLTSKVLTILKDMRRVLVCTHKKRSFLQTRRHTPYISHTHSQNNNKY